MRIFSEIVQQTSSWEIFKIFSFRNLFFFQNHMNWNILHRESFSDQSENFPLSHYLEVFGNLFIRTYNWVKFQQKMFSQKNGHVTSWILSKNFQFSEKKSQHSTIPQIYLSWTSSFIIPSYHSSWLLAAFVVVLVRGVQVGAKQDVQD